MELAIPLLALGGAYVITNQGGSQKKSNNAKTSEKKEAFVNMGKPKQNSNLPNTNIRPINYPVENLSKIVETVKTYPNPNTATDKYFNQDLYEKTQVSGVRVSDNIQQLRMELSQWNPD